MMYSSKLVVAIKHNGRVLREHGDLVRIPFGSEYTVFIKNKNSVRCLVSVEIDGQDATEGVRLIVPANGEIDLERFIKNGNMNAGNRFKFIERSAKIEQHRGIGAEDGLIRVEYEFERQPAAIVNTPIYTPWHGTYNPRTIGDDYYFAQTAGSPFRSGLRSTLSSAKLGSNEGSTSGESAFLNATAMNCASASFAAPSAQSLSSTMDFADSMPVNDAGITVAGSESDQKFTYGAYFPTDGVKHVMVLRVAGDIDGQPVKAPVTVKAKPTCGTCGTVNKVNSKFCRECGTALTIL